MIRVLIVDDQFLTRQALRAILKKDANFVIVGEAENGIKALELLDRETVDIAIVDLDMPKMNGFEFTQKVARDRQQTKVIILSSHDDKESINRAISCGARGYLIKDTSIAEVIETIYHVQRGYFQLGPGLFERLVSESNSYELQATEHLSELEIKSKQDFAFLKQQMMSENQQLHQEIFAELEREIKQLKLELKQGVSDFEDRAIQHLKSSLEERVYRQESNFSFDLWRNNYRKIADNISIVESNYKKLLNKIEKEITLLRRCVICILLFFLIEKAIIILF